MDLSDRLRHLPVFPLPSVVLMPSAVLPLHVFEPRYRALVADVVAGDGLMGIATLEPGYEADYEGRPAVYPEIGVGRVLRHELLEDGRSNILLAHVASARVVRELRTDTLYRVFETRRVQEPDTDEAALTGVRALLMQLAASTPRSAQEASRLFEVPGMALCHALARRMLLSEDEQREYLGGGTAERLETVLGRLSELLAVTAVAGEA